ncbi:hypothetical protein DUNSADRAFT_5046 [Dunaliella salina]|uniref:ShKT domain-containing protein n=1 Tax=Dunaliella salina TaxID=3046 RepID=A0ABQ7HAC7_DUNSA|nr:hypothetical protein DUNSADRAFT_5046 [Dunaliella salina]|eukprot:KAF5843809.1 hypothetical protein DUNSADRAFT_5046 [Dunaliella salina]
MYSQQVPCQAHSSLMESTRQVHQLFSVVLLFCSSAQSTSRTGGFRWLHREGWDNDSSCGGWASKGECTSNPGYMLMACPVSCEQCTTPELVRHWHAFVPVGTLSSLFLELQLTQPSVASHCLVLMQNA